MYIWSNKYIEFLGYHVTSEGIQPSDDRVSAISNYPKPETVKDLRRFLGMVNFYRNCIPHAATTQNALNKYLHGSKKNDKTKIVWTDEANSAFDSCKQLITDTTLLDHPRCSGRLILLTDASSSAVGAALHQLSNNSLKPLGFFSKNLSDTQKKYSTYDREL